MLKFIEGKKLFIPVTLLLFGYVYSQIGAAGSYVAALPALMVPTAHFAFVLFFFAFTASSLARLAPGNGPRFLMRNRRYIGLNFALVHFTHGALVLSNLMLTDATRTLPVLAVGGTAYVFLAAMTLTSSGAAVRRLGAKRWKMLHKVGSYYIWGIFIATSAEHIVDPGPGTWIPALCLVALGLRIAAAQQSRKRTNK
ncbi:MAG: ferric reductase-like transmembrane domain-containing protein [Alphaproteobacteria bacterium]|nr:ferric reductase-like transmembrane domain-containing protein [Alphaproteobacteria bacterium]